MRYGIFGDIHGNLEAFDAVLEAIGGLGIDECVCLGDIVGYGANPEECVDKVRALGALTVAGNHDHAVVGAQNLAFFNRNAREAVKWTRSRLSHGTREWLRALSLVECAERFTAVHGSMFCPEAFNYVQTVRDALNNFNLMPQPLLFIGHSHYPFAFFETSPMSYTMDEIVPIDPAIKTVVNVGSVGQPRDENPRACFAVYDTGVSEVRLHRVDYPVAQAKDKIIAAGLPRELGLRLERGK